MTDPKFSIGDHVLFEGKPAIVQHFKTECRGDSNIRFMGYQLGFDDGSFSGWHPESALTPNPQKG